MLSICLTSNLSEEKITLFHIAIMKTNPENNLDLLLVKSYSKNRPELLESILHENYSLLQRKQK